MNAIAVHGCWVVAVMVAGGCSKSESQETAALASGITQTAVPDCQTAMGGCSKSESQKIVAAASGIAQAAVPDCRTVIAIMQFRSMVFSALKMNDEKLYPDKDTIWPHRQNIPVCWEHANHSDGSEESRRGIVRDAVTRSWESVSQVRFTGWGDCGTDDYTGVRISIEDTTKGSYTKALGMMLDGRPAGMVLDLAMRLWTPRCGTGDACLRQVAIHEFGHALGFAHEQNRPDEATMDCRAQAQGRFGTCVFCAPDHESIMSYCNPNWSNSGSLSRCDRCGVAALYGPAGTTEKECADFF